MDNIQDTKDVVINQLRREVNELKKDKNYVEGLQAKIDNLEHLNSMIVNEKQIAEDDANEKSKRHMKLLSELRAELETLEQRTAELEYENQNLQRQNDWFEDTLNQQRAGTEKTEQLLSSEIQKSRHLDEENRKYKFTITAGWLTNQKMLRSKKKSLKVRSTAKTCISKNSLGLLESGTNLLIGSMKKRILLKRSTLLSESNLKK